LNKVTIYLIRVVIAPETTANTQIINYADVLIGEVINNPYKRINFAIDAYIDIIAPLSYDNTFVTYDSTLVTTDQVSL
jgi:hypothetical protein